MTAVFPSSQSVFIKDHDASGKMVIDFARNLKKFAVNQYCQIVPTKKVAGYYLRMTVEEAGRLIDTDLNNFDWPDGNDAPDGSDGLESHEFLPYATVRRAFPFRMGQLTVDQASWDIVAQHSSIKARQAMTARTQVAISEITNTANYAADHLIDVTTLDGNAGNWAQSTSARGDIKRSLFAAFEKIRDDTLDAVELADMILVINSAMAATLAQTQEVVDYIKGSPHALAQIRGELPGTNVDYGLPDHLWGFAIAVEATRKVTTKKGATTARSQILPKATPFLASRPGGLLGVENAPSFSTCTIFAQEEMTVETKIDLDNRRVAGRVVENITAKLTAPAAGVLFQNAG